MIDTCTSRCPRWPLVVLGVLIALFCVYFAVYTFAIVDRYQMGGYDLAIYDQVVWNTRQGDWFRSTYTPGWETLLADHFEPILLPISLLYWVWPSPKALLLLQTIALGLGALPAYWIARDRLWAALHTGPSGERTEEERAIAVWSHPGNGRAPERLPEAAALAFAAAYLLYPPLQSTAHYEFHPSALAVPFLLFALHFLRRGRGLLFLGFIVLAMSTKETIPLTTLVIGLYLLAFRRTWKIGAITAVASAAWFGLAVFVIIPHFNPGGESRYFSGGYYGWLGDSGTEIVTRVVTRPDLVLERLVSPTSALYLVSILVPLAFLSLFGFCTLLPALPAFALNVLSDFGVQVSLASYFHYAAPLVPFVVLSAVDGAGSLVQHFGRFAERARATGQRQLTTRATALALLTALVLVASGVAHLHHGHLPLGGRFYLLPQSDQSIALGSLVAQVPADASLSVDMHLAPHLSQRRDLLLYPDRPDADYQLVDVGYRDWMFHPRDRHDAIKALLQSGEYGVRDGRHRHLLLERGLAQRGLPDTFYTFARAGEPSPQHPLEIEFGGELRLVGLDFHWERPFFPRTYLVLYWEALQPVDRDLRLFAIQVGPSGELLPGTELEFVESVWFPPSRWAPSEVIRTETFHWYTLDPGQFGVALGVVEGPGFWDVEARLRPEVRAAPWDMPILHGETLLWAGIVEVIGQRATWQQPSSNRSDGP